MFYRRAPDAAHKKCTTAVADAVAQVMIKHLAISESGNEAADFAYAAVVLGQTNLLLFDGTPPFPTRPEMHL